MSVRTFCKPRLPDARSEDSNRTEEKEKGSECWEQSSRCPACSQECVTLLILPCSHFMCRQCVASEGVLQPSECHRLRAASLPPCAVWCPSCRHPVELPCWDWSSAASCLPACPALDPACGNKEAAQGGHLQQVRDSELGHNMSACLQHFIVQLCDFVQIVSLL